MGIKGKNRKVGNRVRSVLKFSGVRLRHICAGTKISPPLLQYYFESETPYSVAKLRKVLRFIQRRASRVERMAAILLDRTKEK